MRAEGAAEATARLQARCVPQQPLSAQQVLDGSQLSAAARAEVRTLLSEEAWLVRQRAASCTPLGRNVYVGLAGMAFALDAASRTLSDPRLASAAADLFDLGAADDHERGMPSLLCGESGALVVRALLRPIEASSDGGPIERFVALSALVDRDKDFDDDVLYGRAGLLIGCLVLQPHAEPGSLAAEQLSWLASRLAQHLLERGRAQASTALAAGTHPPAASGHVEPPLLYRWHGAHYLGAAHGLLGVVHALVCWLRSARASPSTATPQLGALATQVIDATVETLDWLLTQLDALGNLPARVDERAARRHEPSELVAWCHGAPGAAIVFAFAARELGVERFGAAAVRFGELSFERGVLRKGPGLCHGLGGNGFAMLALLRLTRDPIWLVRACQFAQAIGSASVRAASRTPDHPYSLFEGEAGAIAFLAALGADDPACARFPFFECDA
ncbi:hypothetical protein KFE25_000547 [Diacronema lutheri]|uniref:Uncharacterized protein n=1 Tax=Diacronema lutheri TaxID=2081491 RepID=A0A8J5XEE9_DIALT|nr:hypothetical protein KFE25_000547 [Diacronema lutheri]